MPIDYSKWEKFKDSDDDEENGERAADVEGSDEESDDDGGGVPQLPRGGITSTTTAGGVQVTRLPQSSRVTFGGSSGGATKGATLTVTPPVAQMTNAPQRATHDDAAAVDEDEFFVTAFTRNGNAARLAELNSASAEEWFTSRAPPPTPPTPPTPPPHLWGQTKHSARIALILPSASIRARDVADFSLSDTKISFSVEWAATAESPSATHRQQTKVEIPLAYRVRDEERFVEGCWELKTVASRNWRLLVIQVEKLVVGQGVYLWWDRAIEGDAPVDPQTFPDRVLTPGELERAAAFKTAWEEAHEMFREKRRAEREAAAARAAKDAGAP